VSKKSIIDWEWRLSELKPTLTLLFSGCKNLVLSLMTLGNPLQQRCYAAIDSIRFP
jgi:hypothetical protein